jgi:hypothetical protein
MVDGLDAFKEEVEERKREVWQVKISTSATCLEVGRCVPTHLPLPLIFAPSSPSPPVPLLR